MAFSDPNADTQNWWYNANRPTGYNGVPILYSSPINTAPSDWNAFRQNFGGGFATEGDYKNWRENQQRTTNIADFVNRMSSGAESSAAMAASARQEAAARGAAMDEYLKSAAPQFQAAQYEGPRANRFEAGLSSSEKRLSALLDDPSSIQQSAAYKFRLGQGQEAIQRQMAARGMLGSGNRLMELTKYGQDMASQEYDAQAQRLQNLLGTYSGAWNQAQGTNVQEALGKYGTAMQGALGSYGTAMQGHTARGNTLADLYGKATASSLEAQRAATSDRLGWGNLWVNQANKPFQYAPTRAGGPAVKWG